MTAIKSTHYWQRIISHGTEEDLRVCIAKYYFRKPETVKIEGSNLFLDGVLKEGLRVIAKKGRWRFEMALPK